MYVSQKLSQTHHGLISLELNANVLKKAQNMQSYFEIQKLPPTHIPKHTPLMH